MFRCLSSGQSGMEGCAVAGTQKPHQRDNVACGRACRPVAGQPRHHRLCELRVELLQEIGSETDQNPGFRQSGSISVALNSERLAELKRKADFAALFGIEAHVLEVDEITERWPLMNPDGVIGGIHMPSDGSANPVDLTQALARARACMGRQSANRQRLKKS